MQLALNCCPVLFLGLLRFTAGGYKVTYLHFSLGAVVSYTSSFMFSRNIIILTIFHSSRAFNQTDCSGHFWGVGTSWSGCCYRGQVRNVLASNVLPRQKGNLFNNVFDQNPACLYLYTNWILLLLHFSHMCMVMRGVQKMNASTITDVMLGKFHDDANTRREFLSFILRQWLFFF